MKSNDRKAPQHNHLLINAKSVANSAKKSTLTSKRRMKKWLTLLVEQIGMHKIAGPFVHYVNKPGNKGLTAVVMIETSHIALHVWDEPQPAHIQFDIYTCSGLNVYETLYRVVNELQITEIDWHGVTRWGHRAPISEPIAHFYHQPLGGFAANARQFN